MLSIRIVQAFGVQRSEFGVWNSEFGVRRSRSERANADAELQTPNSKRRTSLIVPTGDPRKTRAKQTAKRPALRVLALQTSLWHSDRHISDSLRVLLLKQTYGAVLRQSQTCRSLPLWLSPLEHRPPGKDSYAAHFGRAGLGKPTISRPRTSFNRSISSARSICVETANPRFCPLWRKNGSGSPDFEGLRQKNVVSDFRDASPEEDARCKLRDWSRLARLILRNCSPDQPINPPQNNP